MARRPPASSGRRRRKCGEPAPRAAGRNLAKWRGAGRHGNALGRTEATRGAIPAKRCDDACILPFGKSPVLTPTGVRSPQVGSTNIVLVTTGRNGPGMAAVKTADDRTLAACSPGGKTAGSSDDQAGRIAVTSISIRIAGSISPATTMVDAGGLAPKAARNCGQQAAKSPRSGA